MLLEYCPCDGQPKPGAHFAGVGAGTVIPVKDIWQILGGNAGAVILHLYAAAAVLAAHSAQDEHAVRANVVHGVAKQVVQRALYHGRVGPYVYRLVGHLQLQLPAVLGADRVVPLAHLVAQLGYVKADRLALFRAAGHLCKLHDAGHKGGQPVGFVHDDVHLLVPLCLVVAGDVSHGFGITLDECERCAQVVGDVRQQVPLHLRGILHLPRHVDELPRQVAQLAGAAGVYLNVKIPARNLLRRAGELAQRPCEPLAEQPRGGHCKGEYQRRDCGQNYAQNLPGLGHMDAAGHDKDGIRAVRGCAANHYLRSAAGGLQHLLNLALLPAQPAHLQNGRPVPGKILVFGAVGEGGVVQQAGVEVFPRKDAAQSRVGHVHAEVAQLGVCAQRVIHLLLKFLVYLQYAEIPPGDSLAVCYGLVHQGDKLIGLLGQLAAYTAVIHRLQQLGGKQPEKEEQQQTDKTQKEHQLGADAQRKTSVFALWRRHGRLPARGVRVELIADPPDSGDIAAAGAQVAAQHLDVGIDRPILAEVVVVPHLLQNLLTAQGYALVGRQKDQQIKFLGREADLLAAHLDCVACRIDGKLPEIHHACSALRVGQCAVEHRTHACHQLARREGLDDIVVRAALKAGELVVLLAAGSKNNDRGVYPPCAHLAQAGHPIHKGHHKIQNYKVVPAAV